MTGPVVGVLALQGDVREHLSSLAHVGATAITVRTPAELAGCDAVVLPGGESTTMIKLARIFGLVEPLRERIGAGLPAFGTCAGMILLADRIIDGAADQQSIGGLDVTVRRNAFGRQVDSFESDIAIAGLDLPVHGVFIRAPWVEQQGPDVEVLGTVRAINVGGEAHDRIVAVRSGHVLATAFHPEVGGGRELHRLFVDQVVGHAS